MSSTSAAQRRQANANRTKAMSHPVRRAALMYLADKGESSPVEIYWALGGSLHKIAYHVRELEKFGYVEQTGRVERVRGAYKTFYVATERHLLDTEDWEELPPEEKEGALLEFMQPQIDDFTTALKAGTLGRDGNWIVTRTPIHATDQQGFEEMREAHRELFERITEIQSESLARMKESGESPISVSSGQTCFEVPGF